MNAKRTSKQDKSKSRPPDQSSAGTPQVKENELFPIVGIGASAGGLEAFIQLLSSLPIDTGMAFVLVQHLDPNHKSLLTDILSRITQMLVHEVQDGMVVEPNHVYVIPPNKTMTIAQGILYLVTRERTRKVSMSIDGFFDSLATDRGSQAIGVVLSGGDADGSRGLEAIKAAGGITFAQSEDSAEVSSMPNTAIATGNVDFILPPAEIAEKLVSISRHPYVRTKQYLAPTDVSSTESPDAKDALSNIFSLLRAATRVDFSNYKHTTIKRRIFRRMALYRLENLNDYVRYLQENPAEVQALYQEILIKVTSFFRDAPTFEALKQKVFPTLLRNRSLDSPIRIWVAGCSTGEEAYSIAICLLEFLASVPRKPPIQIFATDVSEVAIEKARLGIYLHSQVVDVSPERLQRFFTQVEDGYQINKFLRELCIFARQNLLSDPPFSRLDLISCRNVFIYFGASLQKKVLSMFHYGLLPNGFLLLGTSETVGESPDLFSLIDQKVKIYTKHLSPLPLNLDLIANSYPMEITTPEDMLLWSLRDITVRKQMEQQLQSAHDQLEQRVEERTAQLQQITVQLQEKIAQQHLSQRKIQEQAALIDIATDAIFVQDLEHRIRFWSQGAERLYGYRAADTIGKKADELFDRQQAAAQLAAAWKQTIEQGFWQAELAQVTQTDQPIIVASRWTLVRDESATPKSILVVNTDITEKKHLEAKYFRAQRLESIGKIASGITHDLNNVLNPILAISQLLLRNPEGLGKRSQEMLQILFNSAQRGASLTKQILSFARGSQAQHLVPLKVGEILTEVILVLKQTLPKSITIDRRIQLETKSLICGDSSQIHQVLMNLCVNARDAMPDGGVITLTAENRYLDPNYPQKSANAHAGNYVVITVADTGSGIPPEIGEQIFEPFFTTKECGTGTGLGLAIVENIVNNHGGFIEVSSKCGIGTGFQVYLPAIESRAT